MRRLLPLLLLLPVPSACGLADDEQQERNRTVYITFTDERFGAFCLREYDLNGDGRVSRYEAQRILDMDCSGCGVRSLWDLREFVRLERLDCSDNELAELDLSPCEALREVDCSGNRLVRLEAGGLRSLAYSDARANLLAGSLDLSGCAPQLQADVRENPALTTVYCRASQSVRCDGATELVER